MDAVAPLSAGTAPREAPRRHGVRVDRLAIPVTRQVGCLVAGDADAPETLVLVHGAGMRARSWTPQLKQLASAMHLVAVDLPGHGDSDTPAEALPEAALDHYAEAVHGVVEALDKGRVFIVGHSLGASVAIRVAAQAPRRVKGLVLISACARLPEHNNAVDAWLAALPPPLRQLLAMGGTRAALFGAGASRASVEQAMRDLEACPAEVMRADIAAAKAMDVEQDARNLEAPTLILCGRDEMLTPPAESQRLQALVPDATLKLVARAGHMLPLESPQVVGREIGRFVARVVGGTQANDAQANDAQANDAAHAGG